MNIRSSLQAISSVAVKEFIHIYRDWRILVLLLILPPVFTLIFGHAFETTGSSNVPALLEDRDKSPASEVFVRQLKSEATFKWKTEAKISGNPDLLRDNVRAALIIPPGWGASLKNGDPIPLPLFLDGSDTNTASELEGRIQESLGSFQKKQLEATVAGLPEIAINSFNLRSLPKVLVKPDASGMVELIQNSARIAGVGVFHRWDIMRKWHDVDGLPFEAVLAPDGLHMNDWSYGCIAKLLAIAIYDAARGPAVARAPRR